MLQIFSLKTLSVVNSSAVKEILQDIITIVICVVGIGPSFRTPLLLNTT